MTDAFAEAAAQTAAPASEQAPAEESAAQVASYDLGDIDSPFLTSSDVNTGGSFGPRCSLEDAVGRLVVMIPQRFIERSPKAERFRQNADDLWQPVADVDFAVLDGGPFSFTYKAIEDDKEVWKDVTDEPVPYVEQGKRLFSAGLAWSVKRTMDQRGILFGVMSYGPANRKSGGDIDSVTASIEAWKRAGSRGEKPRSTYVLDDRPHVLTPQRRQIAASWWNEHRKTLTTK